MAATTPFLDNSSPRTRYAIIAADHPASLARSVHFSTPFLSALDDLARLKQVVEIHTVLDDLNAQLRAPSRITRPQVVSYRNHGLDSVTLSPFPG